MLEIFPFQYCISKVHKLDKLIDISKWRYIFVTIIWLLLLFFKFQENAKSFHRWGLLFIGTHCRNTKDAWFKMVVLTLTLNPIQTTMRLSSNGGPCPNPNC